MAKRILVVDDDRGIADTLKIILESQGYECAVVYSAPEALQFAPKFRPDLVISDVIMPGMSGIELVSKLNAQDRSLPVILLSGNAATSELLAEAGENSNLLTILAKPIPPRELLRVVGNITRVSKIA